MTGSLPFLLQKTDSFEKSFKKLAKSNAYRGEALEIISQSLENLQEDPYPTNARDEPLPSGVNLNRDWTLHKLEIRVGKGAAGQVRLIYLVNEGQRVLRPLWLYRHEQFRKRPSDQDLRIVIESALE
ncbi:MAG: type II toxin-antitoxin system RelE/ParE family toxin [Gloeomargaritaceae cyanobacterium C42_A2020_066]|nr:type II toxin-antitoxin system RelE/ParE family toxin [Gloeomargaritaceae cyanobacterium C42_A2020_066]